MNEQVLEYAPPAPKRQRLRRWIIRISITLAVLWAIAVLLGSEVRHQDGWMCAGCGSRRGESDAFGIAFDRWYERSAMEKWLNDHQQPHAHNWRCVRDTGMNLFGRMMSTSSAGAPPIYSMGFNSLLDQFIAKSTDEEVMGFAHVLATGNELEQLQAVQTAADTALKP
jgi:hypothetical protein